MVPQPSKRFIKEAQAADADGTTFESPTYIRKNIANESNDDYTPTALIG
ncbi:hypothetical protein [Halocatena salina]|uniref:Uncharacterized protein n=1 Tax=Halocatena salina TaxID=2934340 RepID=A0A8T9ZZ50_9EURY|nr:hypothetical protein [Halocatena salina]UPM41709.1 hypothetical protein MW046_06835 [Halocatena salina]